jgi:hypothetical protein
MIPAKSQRDLAEVKSVPSRTRAGRCWQEDAVSALRTEAWPEKLQASLEILRGFNQRSEGGFLKLGETLREVAGLARRLAECAGELAGSGGVMRYREAVGEFEELSTILFT